MSRAPQRTQVGVNSASQLSSSPSSGAQHARSRTHRGSVWREGRAEHGYVAHTPPGSQRPGCASRARFRCVHSVRASRARIPCAHPVGESRARIAHPLRSSRAEHARAMYQAYGNGSTAHVLVKDLLPGGLGGELLEHDCEHLRTILSRQHPRPAHTRVHTSGLNAWRDALQKKLLATAGQLCALSSCK